MKKLLISIIVFLVGCKEYIAPNKDCNFEMIVTDNYSKDTSFLFRDTAYIDQCLPDSTWLRSKQHLKGYGQLRSLCEPITKRDKQIYFIVDQISFYKTTILPILNFKK